MRYTPSMVLSFSKYQGAGNDFVVFDNRDGKITLSTAQIAKLCDRKFGVGADGVILLEVAKDADFRMNYFNSDGSESFCGNGSRAIVAFAAKLGVIKNQCRFQAHDGIHEAEVLKPNWIKVQLSDVKKIQNLKGGYFLDTGCDHFVKMVDELKDYPVFDEGKKLRYDPVFPKGTNVNFAKKVDAHTLAIRTYERGVENETLACGTGAVATAMVASHLGFTPPVKIQTQGGPLEIDFKRVSDHEFTNVFLTGPADLVFKGQIQL